MSQLTKTENTLSADTPIEVMIVDDSLVVRGFLTRFLEENEHLKIVKSVVNGKQALEAVERRKFDLIILDIEMPEMDGLTALPLILEKDPDVSVMIASTLSTRNAEVTLKALRLGAIECLAKPSSTTAMVGTEDFKKDLVLKAEQLGLRTRKMRTAREGQRDVQDIASSEAVEAPSFALADSPERPGGFDVIAIGSSTGGPNALVKLFEGLERKAPRVPIFVTQHMPEKFTSVLAENLSKRTGFTCKEAEDGERVLPGNVYIAPGGYHMLTKRVGGHVEISLNQDKPENFCRPSVDPMLRSIIDVYQAENVLGVILTGMGNDGQAGCEMLAKNGGIVWAQDKETSVVWGMPGAVANAGLCTKVLPLDGIVKEMEIYL